MQRPEHDEGRPGEGAALSVTNLSQEYNALADNDAATGPRCTVCHHRISSAESLRMGIGSWCRRGLAVVGLGGGHHD